MWIHTTRALSSLGSRLPRLSGHTAARVVPAGSGGRSYPLRPELIESVVFLYQATRDESWLVGEHGNGRSSTATN